MNNRNKILIVVITLIIVLGVIAGGTYAWWSWTSADAQQTVVNFTVTQDFTCSADAGGTISSENVTLAPTDCDDSAHAIKRTVKVTPTITGNNPVYLDLWLNVNSIDSGLSNSENFKYALTTNANSCSTGVVNSGTFTGASTGTHKVLLENSQFSSTTTNTYYLWIWLDAAETSPTTMNQNFNLTVGGVCSSTQNDPIATIPSQITNGAVMDNVSSTYVTNSNGVQFNAISSNTNGKGVYIRSGTENNPNPVYYYRGAVTNNNVLFANFCWKIVRTTDTGGVKLIYNGAPSSGKCTITTGQETELDAFSVFNSSSNSLAYVGYMYGTVYPYTLKNMKSISEVYKYGKTFTYSNGTYTLSSTGIKSFADWASNYNQLSNNHYTCFTTGTTCSSIYYLFYTTASTAYYITLTGGKSVEDALAEMLTNSSNSTNSTIKTAIDNWYSSNMTSYTDKLEDTTWCNDRSIYQLNGWNPNGGDTTKSLYFGGYGRANSTYIPSLSCNKNDAFTKDDVAIGNGKLTYPVGLITSDEVMLGGGKGTSNNTYYLYSYEEYWSGSPYYFLSYSFEFYVHSSGALDSYNVYNAIGVRPMVSLKPGTVFTSGDGSANTPYVVN